jgi:thioredoxin reductase
MSMSEYDVAVIGGSAAGLSAALVLTRAGRRVVVIDSGSPRNAPAEHMHGFLSRDGMPPAELLTIGRAEVEGYGGVIVRSRVSDLVPNGRTGFWSLPDVPGVAERWARDVLHCPYCHGNEVAGRQLGVVGGAPGAARYAHIVRQWTHDLVYFTEPGTLTPAERSGMVARAIGVVEGSIEELVLADDHLVGVRMADGSVVPRDALFVPPRFVPNDQLLRAAGCATGEDDWVSVDGGTGRTTVPGIWAAGNVVDPRAQVITAAGAGSAAAIAINADLVDDDVRHAVEAYNLGYIV